MGRDDTSSADPGEDRQYGEWIARQLGPGWVEVAPGIFEPPDAHSHDHAPEGEPERDDEAESLHEALRPRLAEPVPDSERELTGSPGRRGWFRRR